MLANGSVSAEPWIWDVVPNHANPTETFPYGSTAAPGESTNSGPTPPNAMLFVVVRSSRIRHPTVVEKHTVSRSSP